MSDKPVKVTRPKRFTLRGGNRSHFPTINFAGSRTTQAGEKIDFDQKKVAWCCAYVDAQAKLAADLTTQQHLDQFAYWREVANKVDPTLSGPDLDRAARFHALTNAGGTDDAYNAGNAALGAEGEQLDQFQQLDDQGNVVKDGVSDRIITNLDAGGQVGFADPALTRAGDRFQAASRRLPGWRGNVARILGQALPFATTYGQVRAGDSTARLYDDEGRATMDRAGMDPMLTLKRQLTTERAELIAQRDNAARRGDQAGVEYNTAELKQLGDKLSPTSAAETNLASDTNSNPWSNAGARIMDATVARAGLAPVFSQLGLMGLSQPGAMWESLTKQPEVFAEQMANASAPIALGAKLMARPSNALPLTSAAAKGIGGVVRMVPFLGKPIADLTGRAVAAGSKPLGRMPGEQALRQGFSRLNNAFKPVANKPVSGAPKWMNLQSGSLPGSTWKPFGSAASNAGRMARYGRALGNGLARGTVNAARGGAVIGAVTSGLRGATDLTRMAFGDGSFQREVANETKNTALARQDRTGLEQLGHTVGAGASILLGDVSKARRELGANIGAMQASHGGTEADLAAGGVTGALGLGRIGAPAARAHHEAMREQSAFNASRDAAGKVPELVKRFPELANLDSAMINRLSEVAATQADSAAQLDYGRTGNNAGEIANQWTNRYAESRNRMLAGQATDDDAKYLGELARSPIQRNAAGAYEWSNDQEGRAGRNLEYYNTFNGGVARQILDQVQPTAPAAAPAVSSAPKAPAAPKTPASPAVASAPKTPAAPATSQPDPTAVAAVKPSAPIKPIGQPTVPAIPGRA